jgi:hypothetical protein
MRTKPFALLRCYVVYVQCLFLCSRVEHSARPLKKWQTRRQKTPLTKYKSKLFNTPEDSKPQLHRLAVLHFRTIRFHYRYLSAMQFMTIRKVAICIFKELTNFQHIPYTGFYRNRICEHGCQLADFQQTLPCASAFCKETCNEFHDNLTNFQAQIMSDRRTEGRNDAGMQCA